MKGLVELKLRLPNRHGSLARVVRRIAEQRINVASISMDSHRSFSYVRLVVSRPARALRLLRKDGYSVETHTLLPIHLEERPGSLVPVMDCLALAKINVHSTTILIHRVGNRVLLALGLTDFEKARKLLRKEGYYAQTAEALVSNADLVAAAPSISSDSVAMYL